MKKLISILLCVAMLLSVATAVFATDAETDTPKEIATSATLDFKNVANRTKYDETQAVWAQNGITVTSEMNYQENSLGETVPLIASTVPNKDAAKYDGQYFRCYQQNRLTVEYAGMKSIVFTSNTESAAKKLFESIPQYPGLSVVREAAVVTVTFSNPKDIFEIEYATGNINLVTMEVIAWTSTDVATAEQDYATFTIKDLTLTTQRWAYNKEVAKGDAWNYLFLVYDKGFTGTIEFTDDGVAAIVGTDGKLSRIYANNIANNMDYTHFANGKIVSTKNGKVDGEVVDNGQEYGATGQPKYAGYALTQLKEGELLIIFPVCKDTQIHEGVVMARKMWGKVQADWSLTDHYFGEEVVITGIDLPSKPNVDQEAADTVNAQIEAIGEVTLEKEAAITAARAAYEALTDAQKALVTKLETLTAAEKTLADLKAAADQEAADKAAADAVIAKIEAIGEVTKESKEAIEAARAAYNALTDAQKKLVNNLETLTNAENTLEALNKLPTTGDNVVLFFALLALSMTAMVVLVSKKTF